MSAIPSFQRSGIVNPIASLPLDPYTLFSPPEAAQPYAKAHHLSSKVSVPAARTGRVLFQTRKADAFDAPLS